MIRAPLVDGNMTFVHLINNSGWCEADPASISSVSIQRRRDTDYDELAFGNPDHSKDGSWDQFQSSTASVPIQCAEQIVLEAESFDFQVGADTSYFYAIYVTGLYRYRSIKASHTTEFDEEVLNQAQQDGSSLECGNPLRNTKAMIETVPVGEQCWTSFVKIFGVRITTTAM